MVELGNMSLNILLFTLYGILFLNMIMVDCTQTYNGIINNINSRTDETPNKKDISCMNDPEDLRMLRMEVLKTWVERTNVNQTYMRSVYQTWATNDTLGDGSPNPYIHHFVIDGFGAFIGIIVAQEYAVLASDPNNFQLHNILDIASVSWIDDDTVLYNAIVDYKLNFVPGKPELAGFLNQQMIIFEPCTPYVYYDYSRQDPLIARYIVFVEQQTPAVNICTTIMTSCLGNNQVYESFEDCVTYLTGVANNPNPCPGGQIGNTTSCHYFHAGAASVSEEAATIHCQHVRPYDSPTCQDFCLQEGCGNCHQNAHCEFVTPFGQLTPEYGCVCNEGYTGDGVESCIPNTCTAAWQCPSNYNYVLCSNGLCKCKSGFYWNTSVEAEQDQNVCACGPDEFVNWYQGEPECIPVGRCRERWHCPQEDYNSIKCLPYKSNPLIPYNSCLCNYGYENLGFKYDCICASNKREVWSTSQNGKLCLEISECTENWHCEWPKTCHISEGEWLGNCA